MSIWAWLPAGAQYFLTQSNMSDQYTRLSAQQARVALERISIEEDGSLRGAVAQEALDFWRNDPRDMFENLAQSGCQSGVINSLIYYYDTHQFYDTFYDEIEELREDWEAQLGEPIRVKGDLKNFVAWFAFEETAYHMGREDLGLNY